MGPRRCVGLEDGADSPLGCRKPFVHPSGEQHPCGTAPAASDRVRHRGRDAETDLRG